MTAELMNVDQAEDAAASALSTLIRAGLSALGHGDGLAIESGLTAVCRELLRGPLAEDYSRRPGGYCMRAPTDPTLRALGRLGAQIVELSYTSRDPGKALAEVAALLEEVQCVDR